MSASRSNSTSIEFFRRLTVAQRTPSTLLVVFSTRAEQAAQVMPVTSNDCFNEVEIAVWLTCSVAVFTAVVVEITVSIESVLCSVISVVIVFTCKILSKACKVVKSVCLSMQIPYYLYADFLLRSRKLFNKTHCLFNNFVVTATNMVFYACFQVVSQNKFCS